MSTIPLPKHIYLPIICSEKTNQQVCRSIFLPLDSPCAQSINPFDQDRDMRTSAKESIYTYWNQLCLDDPFFSLHALLRISRACWMLKYVAKISSLFEMTLLFQTPKYSMWSHGSQWNDSQINTPSTSRASFALLHNSKVNDSKLPDEKVGKINGLCP